MNPVEVFNLNNDLFEEMVQAMQCIENQAQLMSMSAADYPHHKQKNREKIHKDIFNFAYPHSLLPRKEISLKQALMKFNGGKK